MPSRLLVPRDMMPGNPASEAAYLAYALERATRAGRPLVEDPRAVVPCVNGGRWIFRCPHSKGFSMVDPDWAVAACFDAGCYRVFRTVVWPETAERHEIEAALAERPFDKQHFGFARAVSFDLTVPVETAAELVLETEQQLALELSMRQPKVVVDEPVVEDPIVAPEETTL